MGNKCGAREAGDSAAARFAGSLAIFYIANLGLAPQKL